MSLDALVQSGMRGASQAPRAHRLRRARPGPGVILAGIAVLFFVVAAVAPSLIAPDSPFAINLEATLKAPSIHHLMGTDQSGRDLFSRVIYGTRDALLIGLGATTLALAVAVPAGVAAGLAGGYVDAAISRALEVLFSIPVLLLALFLVASLGQSVSTELIAVGIGMSPGYARLIRGQVLAVRESGYVEAARSLGHPYARIIRRHILPNALRPLIVAVTIGVGGAIIWASGLSFLGLGVAPPSPEWGALLDSGREYIIAAWWVEVIPGLAIVVFALALTTLGRYFGQQREGGSRK